MGRYRGYITLNKGPEKPKKISKKFSQKVQVAVSGMFSIEVIGSGLLSDP